MEIKLKDLVWKHIDKAEEIRKIKTNLSYLYSNQSLSIDDFYFENVEFIAEQKAKILNKSIEYTKQDIIDMFVEAGFEYDGKEYLTVKGFDFDKRIKISSKSLHFYLEFYCNVLETRWIEFNNRKKIDFYYNKFREILEFETNRELEY